MKFALLQSSCLVHIKEQADKESVRLFRIVLLWSCARELFSSIFKYTPGFSCWKDVEIKAIANATELRNICRQRKKVKQKCMNNSVIRNGTLSQLSILKVQDVYCLKALIACSKLYIFFIFFKLAVTSLLNYFLPWLGFLLLLLFWTHSICIKRCPFSYLPSCFLMTNLIRNELIAM